MSLIKKALLAGGGRSPMHDGIAKASLDELLELVVAWARGQISNRQVVLAIDPGSKAVNLSNTGSDLLLQAVKRLVIEGHISGPLGADED